MISLSLPSSSHPPYFQLWWVRPSTRYYPRFSLLKDRSLGFGSVPCHSFALVRTRFPFGYTSRLNLATQGNSQAHDAKGTPSHIPCGIVLRLLVDAFSIRMSRARSLVIREVYPGRSSAVCCIHWSMSISISLICFWMSMRFQSGCASRVVILRISLWLFALSIQCQDRKSVV